MIKFEINGQTIEAEDGAMVIEAADAAGIPIPRFCYHKKLPIAASCRMCLVEVEKAGKPLPSCATPVTEGMRVYTQSPKALAAQKGVMEFLLINHPLDCPICDQGGECELQDIAVGYGKDLSRYREDKRVVKDQNLGPLIATDMTRCIHCTRCVRFGEEIAGIKELGATGRGEHMSIGTYVAKTVDSEMSGNVIDLCPVGALTSKPFRFSARSWELQSHQSIAAHDLVGSNITAQTLRNDIKRVLPNENEQINETWISNRDRFSYSGLDHEERLLRPGIKKEDQWQRIEWEGALETTVNSLKNIVKKHGPEQIGFIVSPSATVEEGYLAQQLCRKLGSGNIDHRIWQGDFRRQQAEDVYPGLGCDIADIEDLDACLLIGSGVRKEQPMIAHRLRKAVINLGAKIFNLHWVAHPCHFSLADEIIAAPEVLLVQLACVVQAAIQKSGKSFPQVKKLLEKSDPSQQHQAIAESLMSANHKAVFIGFPLMMHQDYSLFEALAKVLSECVGCQLGYLGIGANQAGNSIAGVLPHRDVAGNDTTKPGLDVHSMFEQNLKAYVFVGLEPDFDNLNPQIATSALSQAETVVALTAYETPSMREHVDVLLPITPYSETPGTFVNGAGQWQSFNAIIKPRGDSRPAWKVMRVLGNMLALEGFDYITSEQVRDELRAQFDKQKNTWDFWQPTIETPASRQMKWQLLPNLAAASIDAIVRRSAPLQESEDQLICTVMINENSAKELGVDAGDVLRIEQNGQSYELPVQVSVAMPDNCVMVPLALSETQLRSAPFTEVNLVKQGLQTAVNE